MKKNMKRWIVCTLMVLGLLSGWFASSTAQASVQQDFINRLSPDIINVSHQYNLYPSVMMAQAALESDFGQSSLSTDADNYFGIKGDYNGQSVQMPTMEYNQQGQPYYVNTSFKKYPSTKASIEDNAKLIRDGIYGDPSYYSGTWRENASDGVTAANALGGKYATDPNYANNLVSLIQEYNLNSLLDNAWKKLHINKLKKKAKHIAKKLKQFRKTYSLSKKPKASKQGKKNNQTKKSSYQEIVKYTKLYNDNQAALKQNYHAYKVYDHLNQMDLDNWKRLDSKIGKAVYIDMMGQKKGDRYYRIRFKPSDRNMYWVKSSALKFIKPRYYKRSFMINAQQLNLGAAYNQILGTGPSVKVLNNSLRKSVYHGNKFAIVTSGDQPTWYHIKSDQGKYVWVTGNPNRPTQYLNYSKTKALSSQYTQAPLQNHAADPAYHGQVQSEAWSNVKPKHNKVRVNCLAIDTQQNNQFWYRISNQHRTGWTNEKAFKA